MTAPRRIRILGTGVARPERAVASADLDLQLGLAPGTVERRTGVQQRYVEVSRTAAELGAAAAAAALGAAALTLDDIDCLVAASGTPDQAMPNNAALIHRALGMGVRNAPAFDVNASCLSFLAALDIVASLVDTGRYRRVLVVSADIASCGLDWHHLEESAIFGDGAAAAVIGRADDTGSSLLASALATFSQGAHYCEIKGGGSRHHPSRIDEPFPPLAQFRMDGQAVFGLVGRQLKPFVDGLMAAAGISIRDLAAVVPHQASRHGLAFVRRRLRIGERQLIDIFADHGNQVGASLPFALDTAIASGRIRRGDRVLLLGSGAGVSLGGAVMTY